MAAPDPDQIGLMKFVVNNTAEIVTGITILLLGALKVLGRQDKADAAKDVLKSDKVTHYELDARLARCQLEVTKNINHIFDELRDRQDNDNKELRIALMQEIKELHTRLNDQAGKIFNQRS